MQRSKQPAPVKPGLVFVVADEVRSLAIRSSTAAQETAALIEESANKINRKEQVTDTCSVFDDLENHSTKVGSIIQQIADGAIEQTQGMEQLHTTIQDIRQLSQHTAETANRNSLSAAELQRQYGELHNVLEVLGDFMGHGNEEAKSQQLSLTMADLIKTVGLFALSLAHPR